MTQFKSPKKYFEHADPRATARLLSAASDLALVVASDGAIKDISYSDEAYDAYGVSSWVGRKWSDVVTGESVPKVERLLSSSGARPEAGWSHINHPHDDKPDMPVRYRVVKLGSDGPFVAIGQDMTDAARLQQKLVAAQAQIDREYARQVLAETRYQALFRFSSEPTLILNASNLEIVEVNDACLRMFENGARPVAGRRFGQVLSGDSIAAFDNALASARTSPKPQTVDINLNGKSNTFRASVAVFRDQSRLNYLVRLSDPEMHGMDRQDVINARRRDRLIEALPEGFLVVGKNRRVVSANTAMCQLVQLATPEQLVGEPVSRWLGRTEVDADVLFTNLDENGSVSRYGMTVRTEMGTTRHAEIVAVSVTGGEDASYGLIVRDAEQDNDFDAETTLLPVAGHTVEQVKDLVGRAPLRELVRQTTDIVERMCIEAALELTGDNRASAAEMLGLSRQSLYLKLRRHQMGGLSED